MSRKKDPIPVRSLTKESGNGIAVAKVSSEAFRADDETMSAHRHDYHFFVLQEAGVSHTEIDFEQYLINEPTIIYQSPDQVHRAIKVENFEVYMLVINNENLNADYLNILQGIAPLKPLKIGAGDLAIIRQAFILCCALYERTTDRLYFSLLKDSCNALIALIISQYLKHSRPADNFSRFEVIERSFTTFLEQNFKTMKRPADYARMLNISVPYLNECVRNVTGISVSAQIHNRIILEAKRLLFHSSQSVKEIAASLGYTDYAYFSRLFAKLTGSTAVEFRNKNHD